MRRDLHSLLRGILIKTDRGSCARRPLLPRYFCRQGLLQPITDFGKRCFYTAALFNVRIPFQDEHFMTSLVVFLPELQRGGAANSPDFPPSGPSATLHRACPIKRGRDK
jgi:hypothetical protein